MRRRPAQQLFGHAAQGAVVADSSLHVGHGGAHEPFETSRFVAPEPFGLRTVERRPGIVVRHGRSACQRTVAGRGGTVVIPFVHGDEVGEIETFRNVAGGFQRTAGVVLLAGPKPVALRPRLALAAALAVLAMLRGIIGRLRRTAHMQRVGRPGQHPVGFEEAAVHAVTHRHDRFGADRQVGIPRPFGQRDIPAQVGDRRVALVGEITLRDLRRDGITRPEPEGVAAQQGFERVEARFVAEQELLAAVEQTVQAAKQRMYVRRFPGTQTGCGDDEKGREKERQFFHFRQRICTNITIKSMQKQIIGPVLFV